ncbi:Predicted transcriptional regulator YheO, contains PAS and DNA-binding HTH domains [Roseateles sp. YR242]|uniref:helix-turn-helix transcriptional regulator n=1 Tax=Roseateles sp. YR242 TaxID=1855305 RepID=UPI0008BB30F7|nr:PAS domain-containing protein [Roseateles sp. YR242]SEK87587.1 Predicted transcriptional regulator YheO, contains PAS and DNA-binding HTH domains [Roseateles sp. YR242]
MSKRSEVETVKPKLPRVRKAALPAAVAAERAALFTALRPVVQMLGSMVGPNTEVLLHDLTRPEHSIQAIANGHISNRSVGDSIISGPRDDVGFHEAQRQLSVKGKGEHSVIMDYPTVTDGGLRLRSSTVLFRDSLGEPFAALCLNADMTMFEATHAWLEGFLKMQARPSREASPQPAMDTLMQDIIDDAVRRLGKPVSLMNKDEKTQAVQAMLQRGLFIVKGGVELAAQALGVSRFTIYNYMEALRLRGDADESHLPKGMTRGTRR